MQLQLTDQRIREERRQIEEGYEKDKKRLQMRIDEREQEYKVFYAMNNILLLFLDEY